MQGRRVFLITVTLFVFLSVSSAEQDVLLLVRGDGDWRPYEWEEEPGDYRGVHIDLVREAARQAGIELRIEQYPWPRAIHYFKNGNADGLFYLFKNAERSEYTAFDDRNIISQAKLYVVVRKGFDFTFHGDLEELRALRVGVIRGFSYGASFVKKQDKLDLEEFSSMAPMIRSLAAGRVDAVLVNYDNFIFGFQEDPLFEEVDVLTPPFDEISVYLGFSKTTVLPATLERFAGAMERVKQSSFYLDLLIRYAIPEAP